MELDPILKNIRVILFEVQHSGNLGAVARAMKNFGLSDLVLVRPKAEINEQARSMASKAQKILREAKRVSSLSEALNNTQWAIGFTGLKEKRSEDQIPYEELIPLAMETACHHRIALVFGREDWGLSHEAIDCCRYLTHLPLHPHYESLNLSQAVLLAAFHLFNYGIKNFDLSSKGFGLIPAKEQINEADFSQRKELYEDLLESLKKIGLIHPLTENSSMRNIRRFLERTKMSQKEIKIFRGFCRQLRWAKKRFSLDFSSPDPPKEF